jgi:hypothetical protein
MRFTSAKLTPVSGPRGEGQTLTCKRYVDQDVLINTHHLVLSSTQILKLVSCIWYLPFFLQNFFATISI